MHFEVVVERLSSLVERVAGGLTGSGGVGDRGGGGSSGSVFGAGWESSMRRGGVSGRGGETLVPWSTVEDVIKMARDALSAKQRVAELLRAEASRLQVERTQESEHLSKRAVRAETDSGSLLEQLESLISAKRVIALERAELSRTVAQLKAERELICHQLHVDPASTNLCGAVESALGVAARQRRQMRVELDTAREALSSSNAMWQAREASLRRALAAAGLPEPSDLPPAPVEVVEALLSRAARESNAGGDDDSGSEDGRMFDRSEHEEEEEGDETAVAMSDGGAEGDDAASHREGPVPPPVAGSSNSAPPQPHHHYRHNHHYHAQHAHHVRHAQAPPPPVAAAAAAASAVAATAAAAPSHSGPLLRAPGGGGGGAVAAAAAMWQRRAAGEGLPPPQPHASHADAAGHSSHSGRLPSFAAAGLAGAQGGGGDAGAGNAGAGGLLATPSLASSMFINAV